jgi:hypothetical protein
MDGKDEEKSKYAVPKSTTGDVMHTLARAGISSLPAIGGPATELFNSIIIPPLNKRREKWMESVASGLTELEKGVAGFSITSLSENQMFLTIVSHATYVAIRNHEEEKLLALKNAVINTALTTSPDEDIRLMFINFVDFLTPWHLKILKLLHNPTEILTERGIGLPSYSSVSILRLIQYAYPELRGRDDFLNQICRDLYNRGLIVTDSFGIGVGDFLVQRTSNLGNQFIDFISSH